MILEEQMYAYRSTPVKLEETPPGEKKRQTCVGRNSDSNVKKGITKVNLKREQPSATHRKPWTVEEQELFEQGLELYGRSWTKIASMIETRTALQVKNYAKQYFKQKNKTLAQSVAAKEEQSNETIFVSEVQIQQVLDDNIISEDDQVIQSTAVLPSVVEEKAQNESDDEDIEVDVDGSDSEQSDIHLIPGQTTSCPDAVYSALVRAAEVENQQISLEENPANIPPESISPNTSKTEASISAIDERSSPNVDKKSLSENRASSSLSNSCLETASLNKTILKERMTHDGRCYGVEYGNHLLNECEEQSFSEKQCFPDRLAKSLKVIAENDSVQNENTGPYSREPVAREKSSDVSDSGLNTALPSMDDIEWIAATSSEVTSSELIDSLEREQPGADATLIQPITIDRSVIQDLEKDHNMEFFMGRALKTPERYMKIRNYILDMWEKTKPNFLFKTAVRSGLRNCGDVNSIGRVHAFLEDIGAINEGCFDRPVPRVRQQDETTDAKVNVHMESWVNSLRPRRKRQRNEEGDWIDPSKAEGMTIQHLSPDEEASPNGSLNEKGSPSVPRKRPSRSKPSYDPFLLVPCRKFPSQSAVPFDVHIQSETLVVMDTHAHMSTTEVIGLLGGHYSHDSRVLKVSKAIPCRSLSTGLQCEMDPVSQTQASEDLALRGLAVVGWYHSHPTFAPIPSVRDIETQAKFQEWFAKGGAPFIGIIVSPYNYSNLSNQSQIRCLTISDEWESAGQYRLPYQFDYEVFRNEADEDETVEQVRNIADDYRRYPFRVQLNRRFGVSTNLDLLDKLLDSLHARISASSDGARDAFLTRLKNTISENIKAHTPISDNQPTRSTPDDS
ncbi:histone H2A deubiquitinase MYSM1-like isoform X2 [Stylophora pistillata]|nr:histone H2A deubiquitinase MYSM1-like isoform X2 [Stylophora pistillata]XP_022802346.1 histone H2A deubiquitinase MYSM1-like isoform X2 [Stylophora pistillata]